MNLEIDLDELSTKVAKNMLSSKNVWEDYAPIVKSDKGVEIFLHEGINVPGFYSEIYHTLTNLSEDKEAVININNGGGFETGASLICHGLRNTKARTVANLSGLVASAATLVTMECDDIILAPDTIFMIHESSFEGLGGKFSDMKTFKEFYETHTRRMSNIYYGGFLTEDEIELMHNGKEKWLNSDEVMERWNKRKESKGG